MFRYSVFITFFLLIGFSSLAHADTAELPSTADNFEGHEYVLPGAKVHYVESEIVGDTYELRVTLPGAYYTNPQAEFPVAYVLDGQWGFTMVSDINGKLGYDGMIPNMIVVAITWAGENVDYNLKRQRDFTHSTFSFIQASGGAVNFLNAIEQEIIPFVDMVYRTNDQRTLMGASLGGLFSTYAMLEKPKLFSGYIALAAPYSLEQAYFDQRLAELKQSRTLEGVRIYLAVGSYDFNVSQVMDMAKQLREAKLRGLKVKRKKFSRIGHAGVEPVAYTYGLQYIFDRPKLKITPQAVALYSGRYVIDPNFPSIDISFDGRKLLLDQEGAETAEFYANSESTFYFLGANYQLEFVTDDTGLVTLLVNSNGSIFPFVKQ